MGMGDDDIVLDEYGASSIPRPQMAEESLNKALRRDVMLCTCFGIADSLEQVWSLY